MYCDFSQMIFCMPSPAEVNVGCLLSLFPENHPTFILSFQIMILSMIMGRESVKSDNHLEIMIDFA